MVLLQVKIGQNTFDNEVQIVDENSSQHILKNDQESKESDIALPKHLKYVKNNDNQEYLNNFNANRKSFFWTQLGISKSISQKCTEIENTTTYKMSKSHSMLGTLIKLKVIFYNFII